MLVMLQSALSRRPVGTEGCFPALDTGRAQGGQVVLVPQSQQAVLVPQD